MEDCFNEGEIKEPNLICDGYQSVGSNEFSFEFLKKSWDLVKEDI